MTKQLQHDDMSAADHGPAIALWRCRVCAQLTYPAAAYGCSRCGAARDSGDEVSRPARGELLNWVTVHVDLVPGLKAPYVVGEVRLAPGVVEEVLIEVSAETQLSVGQQMVARAPAAQATGSGNDSVVKPALRFVPATTVAGGAQ